MNRGYEGNEIFSGSKYKSQFLDYLEDAAGKMKIRLFAYCVMDTHYHLVLQNSSGRMSDFLRLVNGRYGMYYRKMEGGVGYVFQSRFKSTLIENDSYLLQSILYLLRNPVRAGIVPLAQDYTWSSGQYYYSGRETELVDTAFVNELFGSREEYLSCLYSNVNRELPVVITKYGEIMGSEDFLKSALEKHDRRNRPSHQSIGVRRKEDLYFEPVEKVLWEFERMNGTKIEDINARTLEGKRLRGELLIHLKERAGLKYREIGEFDLFEDLSFSSLRSIYRNMRSKKKT